LCKLCAYVSVGICPTIRQKSNLVKNQPLPVIPSDQRERRIPKTATRKRPFQGFFGLRMDLRNTLLGGVRPPAGVATFLFVKIGVKLGGNTPQSLMRRSKFPFGFGNCKWKVSLKEVNQHLVE
jgi:hypothetical protein